MIKFEYYGQFDDPSGYGNVARGYAEELVKREEINLKLNPYNFFQGYDLGFSVNHSEFVNKNLENPIVLQHMTPDNFEKRGNRYNIGYVPWETTLIPRDWIKPCKLMDEIWTPSEHSKQAFINRRIKNVFVIPHGIDLKQFCPGQFKLDIVNRAAFNFLSIFQWNFRKGFDVLLEAYLKEFKEEEEVALILKTHGFNNSVIEQQRVRKEIWRLKNLILGSNKPGPKIIFLREMLPRLEYLYRLVDCFVLPSRGEGWGMPYLEAMACRIPTIGTNYSGNLEFMNEKNSKLIDIKGEVPCSNMLGFKWYTSEMKWADPSVSSLQEVMRDIFEHRGQAQKMALRGWRDAKKWTWKKAVDKMVLRLQEIDEKRS